jgi:hypothetical protein
MDFTELAATFYLTYVITCTDGPLMVFDKIRKQFPEWALWVCPWCMSLWVALGVHGGVHGVHGWSDLVSVFALAGVASSAVMLIHQRLVGLGSEPEAQDSQPIGFANLTKWDEK